MANNLIHICEEEGIPLGTLFVGKTPTTKQATATFFELKEGSTIHRLLTGNRSCESFMVVMQVNGSNKEDASLLGQRLYRMLDAHTPFMSKDRQYTYMSVLATGPLVQVDLDLNERFTFEAVFTVMRKEQ